MTVTPRTPAPAPDPVVLADDERRSLLELARVAVATATGARPDTDLRAAAADPALLSLPAGAFVTLTEGGELRGCMGTLDDTQPAWASVLRAARLAARSDPRFAAVASAELGAIHLEVSVLGPIVTLADPADFRPGVDGIVIERGGRRGLLLPEVADQLPPGHDAMLVAVCRKAGLAPDAWRDPATSLFVFRTCRFGGSAV